MRIDSLGVAINTSMASRYSNLLPFSSNRGEHLMCNDQDLGTEQCMLMAPIQHPTSPANSPLPPGALQPAASQAMAPFPCSDRRAHVHSQPNPVQLGQQPTIRRRSGSPFFMYLQQCCLSIQQQQLHTDSTHALNGKKQSLRDHTAGLIAWCIGTVAASHRLHPRRHQQHAALQPQVRHVDVGLVVVVPAHHSLRNREGLQAVGLYVEVESG